MRMKHTLGSILGILLLAGVGQSDLRAASETGAKASGTRTSHKPQHKGTIARTPYLGAIVVEASTGKVLFEQGADTKGYPASVLKLMDLLIILEKIERHELSPQDEVPVSAKAAKTGGSQVWLAE